MENAFTDSIGTWQADKYFNIAGEALNAPASLAGFPTLSDRLRTARCDVQGGRPMWYRPRPLEIGVKYTVRLTFVELEFQGPNQRKFELRLDEETVFTELDIFAEAGGFRKPLIKEYNTTTFRDYVNVRFAEGSVGVPCVSSVEILEVVET